MCGNWEGWGGLGAPGAVVWEGGEAQMGFLGAAVRAEHYVSFQSFCMCVGPLDLGNASGTNETFKKWVSGPRGTLRRPVLRCGWCRPGLGSSSEEQGVGHFPNL